MTQREFEKEYKRLVAHFKFGFENQGVKEALARKVATLDHAWWIKTVDEAIASNDDKFDFAEVIRFEKTRRSNIRLAQKEDFRTAEILKSKITDEGLENALDGFGAQSVWDAVQKSRGVKE